MLIVIQLRVRPQQMSHLTLMAMLTPNQDSTRPIGRQNFQPVGSDYVGHH